MSSSKKTTATICVTGFESVVEELAGKLRYQKTLTGEVNAGKAALRESARNLIARAPAGTKTLRFVGSGGADGVDVSLPDASMSGNRKALKPEDVSAFTEEGLPMDALVERHVSITLKGAAWITWFDELLTAWAQQGVDLSGEDLEYTRDETTCLSANGAAQLQTIAAGSDPGAQLAKAVLRVGVKEPSVGLAKK